MIPLVSAIMMGSGGSVPTVLISDQTKTGSAASSIIPASAGVKLLRNGQYHTGTSNTSLVPTYADVGGNEWSDIEYSTVGDSYECRMDTIAGTVSSGTVDSWVAMSATEVEWNVSITGSTKQFQGTLRIRRVGAASDSDTAAILITAISI